MPRFVTDTHTHTVASGHAYSTIIENCAEAARKGLKLIAMTDHGPAMPGGPHIFHFGNLVSIPQTIHGVEVLKGAEANIVDFDGNLDLDEYRLKRLDLVIASLHDVVIKPGSIEQNTRAIINAMKNRYVDIIGHSGNPAFPIDVDEVLKAAREYNVLIEINNSSFVSARPGSQENCSIIARRAYELGVKLALGSDAHISFNVGEFEKAESIISELGIPDEAIVSTDAGKLISYLKNKGKLKKRGE